MRRSAGGRARASAPSSSAFAPAAERGRRRVSSRPRVAPICTSPPAGTAASASGRASSAWPTAMPAPRRARGCACRCDCRGPRPAVRSEPSWSPHSCSPGVQAERRCCGRRPTIQPERRSPAAHAQIGTTALRRRRRRTPSRRTADGHQGNGRKKRDPARPRCPPCSRCPKSSRPSGVRRRSRVWLRLARPARRGRHRWRRRGRPPHRRHYPPGSAPTRNADLTGLSSAQT